MLAAGVKVRAWDHPILNEEFLEGLLSFWLLAIYCAEPRMENNSGAIATFVIDCWWRLHGVLVTGILN